MFQASWHHDIKREWRNLQQRTLRDSIPFFNLQFSTKSVTCLPFVVFFVIIYLVVNIIHADYKSPTRSCHKEILTLKRESLTKIKKHFVTSA
mgnify:FL=1